MLEKIKKTIFAKYPKTDNKGLFLSIFDTQGQLIISNGVVFTDKDLNQLIETLYHGLIEKYTNNITKIVIDIVTSIQEITNPQEIQNISPKQYGLILTAGNKSGVLLPNTVGIDNITQALKAIKDKNGLTGNANIIKFTTDRFSI